MLAIGNPFGLGSTVTMGIVSGLGRQLGKWAYEDFIQTDAAINGGNSGGALINAHGALVGINTANYREQDGAQGIGFAIPVKTAKGVLDQIVEHGQVVRGFIGAEFGPVQVAADSALPAAARGAMVLDVYPGNALQAGLQPGDVLLRIDDHDILDASELRAREAAMKPGTKVRLSGLRAGQPIDFNVELVQRPAPNRVRIPSG